ADSAQARATLAFSLAFRGHLRAAYQTGARQFGSLFAQLALLGAVPADSAEAVFREWIGPQRRYPLWWALPWWTARRDTAGILSVRRWAETGLRSLADTTPAFAKEILTYVTQSARAYLTLERGRVHERLGNRDTAVTAYAFVAAVWAHADLGLQPYVDEARAGLTRLGGEPRR